MGTSIHFIIDLFRKVFLLSAHDQTLREERQKETVLLALYRLDLEANEVQPSTAREIHMELRRMGRKMPESVVPELCASLVKAGFVHKIGDKCTYYVINDRGLNHLGLPGR